jgi:ergothioneine biosynthesis protein EgtB
MQAELELHLTPSHAGLLARYRAIRSLTEVLCRPLSVEDQVAQSMPEASPAKWHLAHTTWFFETFVLRRAERHFHAHRQGWAELFNSYYEAEGPRHARERRGLLTRPSAAEVMDYRHATDERIERWLSGDGASEQLIACLELGLQHEEQHQELLLTDVQHLLAQNPLRPRYVQTLPGDSIEPERHYIEHEGGLVSLGHGSRGFAFDNERPGHEVYLAPFELGSWLVTNREYLQFIADGGYRRPELWLAEGWAAVQREGWLAPLYWVAREGEWRRYSLHGEIALDPHAPACHVSYYEADAYARWAHARLPTEAEWETLAREDESPGQALDLGSYVPLTKAGTPSLRGGAWIWTQSAYAPYPGFAPARGALGEYNGKFMVSQLVLRGGSCFTPFGHARVTYRNFFYPHARWQVTGVRLARGRAPRATSH